MGQRNIFDSDPDPNRLPANAEIGARGASDQHNQVSGDEQAAHIAGDRFQTQLVPCYRTVASARRSQLESAMTDEERRELARQPLVASDGRPLVAGPLHTRLGSPNADARMAARRTLREIFVIYENVDPDEAALSVIAGKIDALRFNEGVRL